MAVDFTGRYLGDLKVEVTHGPSGTQLITVPPVDSRSAAAEGGRLQRLVGRHS